MSGFATSVANRLRARVDLRSMLVVSLLTFEAQRFTKTAIREFRADEERQEQDDEAEDSARSASSVGNRCDWRRIWDESPRPCWSGAVRIESDVFNRGHSAHGFLLRGRPLCRRCKQGSHGERG